MEKHTASILRYLVLPKCLIYTLSLCLTSHKTGFLILRLQFKQTDYNLYIHSCIRVGSRKISGTAQTGLRYPKPEKIWSVESFCPDWCWKWRRGPTMCGCLSRNVASTSSGYLVQTTQSKASLALCWTWVEKITTPGPQSSWHPRIMDGVRTSELW